MTHLRTLALPVALAAGLISHAAFADTTTLSPEQFVNAWPIAPTERAPAYRLELTPEVMASLTDPNGRDLALVDRHDRPITLYRLGPGALLERQTVQHSLVSSSRWVEASHATPGSPLYLRLQQGDQTLLIQGQSPRPPAERQQLVFEALVALPDQNGDEQAAELHLDWWVEAPMRLNCWLGEANSQQPASTRLTPQLHRDGFPRHYRAVHALPDASGDALQLFCFGERDPGEQDRFSVSRVSQRHVNHAGSMAVSAQDIQQDNGVIQFATSGPWSLKQIQIALDDESWTGQLGLHSAAQPDGPWRLVNRSTEQALGQPTIERLIGPEAPRHRYWELTFEPPIVNPASLAVTARSDSLVFLHQGEPPWRLLAGSREGRGLQAGELRDGSALGGVEALWQLPLVSLSAVQASGGPQALDTPPRPTDWSQVLLWLVLLGGGLLVISLAWQLLSGQASTPEKDSDRPD
ncbi:MAG: DUF3999 family protein [Wenzhouxiangella sp.]